MPYKKKFYKKSRIKKSIIKNSVIKKITDPLVELTPAPLGDEAS